MHPERRSSRLLTAAGVLGAVCIAIGAGMLSGCDRTQPLAEAANTVPAQLTVRAPPAVGSAPYERGFTWNNHDVAPDP